MSADARRGSLVAAGRTLETASYGPPPDEAPTLVFLHEGLGSLAQWRDVPAVLADRTGLGALVYSRAGYGGSDPVPLPRPVDFMHREALESLPEVLDGAGVREAVLVGHSDGASIALVHAAAARGRERIRGLVLEAPHVFVEDITVDSIERAAETYRTTDLREKLAKYHGDNVDIAFWGWNRVWLDPTFRAWNLEEYVPRITVPMLLVQGRDDVYGTTKQLDAIASASRGPIETVLLDDCGHSPHRDQREATLGAIERFVRALFAVSALALLLGTSACTRAAPPADKAPSPAPPAPPAHDAEAAIVADAAPPPPPPTVVDAGARVFRPVVIHAFRKSALSGKTDAVGPRSAEPDGEQDAVFELVVEGDVESLVVWSDNASTSAHADLVVRPPPPPSAGRTLLPPLQTKPRPYAMTKHAPDLFVFEGKALVAADAGTPAGKRTLRLHTWVPRGAGGPWHVLVFGQDGTEKRGPSAP